MHRQGVREYLWWILILVALAAVLLFGAVARPPGDAGRSGARDSRSADFWHDYWTSRAARPFE